MHNSSDPAGASRTGNKSSSEQKRNYQKELDLIIKRLEQEGRRPHLLLHSCCAPCSSHCLEYLQEHFEITVFYYNPNIAPESEYRLRVEEQQRLIRELCKGGNVHFLEGPYDPQRFYEAARGLELVPEGGERCTKCFELRLREAAKAAQECGAEYFTTTLTISPLKDARRLNSIGLQIQEEMQEKISREAGTEGTETERVSGEQDSAASVKWLVSDFKKKNGYRRSIELSEEYGLYRQNYCGCVFSRREPDREREE
ncbi:MAG: epoxyqueuosine reductase QueH [Lachnospiraceae bacterium]|nr:epoxyqueuosine reductase QueH [Lachnospiraceae bacterium]